MKKAHLSLPLLHTEDSFTFVINIRHWSLPTMKRELPFTLTDVVLYPRFMQMTKDTVASVFTAFSAYLSRVPT